MASSTNEIAPGAPLAGAGQFNTTHWSVVLSAADRGNPAEGVAALEKLCRVYWPPLYAFIRRQGASPPDAQDLTQEFFARLLENDGLASVDRRKGRFRSFLLASLKNFLANERDRARAQKRGGGQLLIPLDAQPLESQCGPEPAEHVTPEKIFERRWAVTLLEQCLARLRRDYAAEDREGWFAELKVTLTEPRGSIPYAEIAARLNQSEAAVKMAAHRLRVRYREVIRAEIADTVSDPDEIEDELRHIFLVLAR